MPVTQPHMARQVGRTLWLDTIQERRQRIADLARCRGCGSDNRSCHESVKAIGGPEGMCCIGGIPGHGHVEDPRLVSELLAEVAAGEVRTVAEAYPAPVLGPDRVTYNWLIWQDTWWYPHRRPAVRIAEMEKPYRLNVANFVERKAGTIVREQEMRMIFGPQPGGDMAGDAFDRELDEMGEHPITWLRGTPLLQVLRKGLPGGGEKLARLQARALHWHTCPMRLAPEKRPRGPHDTDPTCTCVRVDGRCIGATNDPNPVPVYDRMSSTETYPEPS
jgi:hypothetical protein